MFLFAEMDEMTTSDWVRLIGVPLVTFLLGLTSALLIWYFKRKTSIIAWGLISEDSFFTPDIAADVNMPIQILVNNQPHNALTAVKVRIGCAGTEVLTDIQVVVTFNSNAKIFRVKPQQSLGEYKKPHLALVDLLEN